MAITITSIIKAVYREACTASTTLRDAANTVCDSRQLNMSYRESIFKHLGLRDSERNCGYND
jgi:hypothetical protein